MTRVIFSPTTTPMLPPMKAYSIAATTHVRARRCGRSRRSRRPSAPWPAASAAAAPLYGLVSTNSRGSVETQPASYSTNVRRRTAAAAARSRRSGSGARISGRREVGGEILVVDGLRAARALHPEAFGNLAGLAGDDSIGLRLFLNHAMTGELRRSGARLEVNGTGSGAGFNPCAVRRTACRVPIASSICLIAGRRPSSSLAPGDEL